MVCFNLHYVNTIVYLWPTFKRPISRVAGCGRLGLPFISVALRIGIFRGVQSVGDARALFLIFPGSNYVKNQPQSQHCGNQISDDTYCGETEKKRTYARCDNH